MVQIEVNDEARLKKTIRFNICVHTHMLCTRTRMCDYMHADEHLLIGLAVVLVKIW